MFYLTNRDYATLILDSGTLFIIFGIIAVSFRNRKKDRLDEDCFLVLLILNIVIAIGDILGYLCGEGKNFPHSYALSTLGMTLFYVGFVLIAMSWLHYCRVRFRGADLTDRSHFAYEYIPGMVMVAVVIINVFTGWVFSYDENKVYLRGFMFIPLYIVVAAYILAGFVYLSRYRDKSSGKALIPVWVYGMPIILGTVLTFLVQGSASFAAIGVAMSFMFTHMGTINDEA